MPKYALYDLTAVGGDQEPTEILDHPNLKAAIDAVIATNRDNWMVAHDRLPEHGVDFKLEELERG